MECNQLTLVLRTKVQFKRNKQNVSKCEHFLDFVFMSGLLQDVAYGVTKIKYDSAEEQKVALAVLTTKYSHATSFYLQSCSINGLHSNLIFSIVTTIVK